TVLIATDLQITFQVVSLTSPETKDRSHHGMEEVESPFCGIGVRPRCSCDPVARSDSAESLREPAGTGVPGREGGSPWLKLSFDSENRTGRMRFAQSTSPASCPSMRPKTLHSISPRPCDTSGLTISVESGKKSSLDLLASPTRYAT